MKNFGKYLLYIVIAAVIILVVLINYVIHWIPGHLHE